MKIFKIVEDGFYKNFYFLVFLFLNILIEKSIEKYEALFDRVCKLDACYNIEKSLNSRYLVNLYFAGEIISNKLADKNRSSARLDLKERLSASLFFRNTELWDAGHDFGKEMAFRKRILGV